MKLLYKPFGIVFGLLGGMLAKRLFERLWSMIDREQPPAPTTRDAGWVKAIGAAALEGATQRATRAAVDRAGARSFERLTGSWPGELVSEPAESD
jgi:Protein of unknown function (DUF4235)